jgi:general secretion pathway protein D
VVLGGLVTDNVTFGISKVPILGDIPLVGRLFRRDTKRVTKRNLLIFLTPYIVRDATDFRRIFARKMQERREFIDRYTAFEYHEVQPNIDYDRTNGMLQEINATLGELDEHERQRQLLETVEEPEHTPRSPVGEVPESVLRGGGAEEEEEGTFVTPAIRPPSLRRATSRPRPPTAVGQTGEDEE